MGMRCCGEVNRATECAVRVMGDCYAAVAAIHITELHVLKQSSDTRG